MVPGGRFSSRSGWRTLGASTSTRFPGRQGDDTNQQQEEQTMAYESRPWVGTIPEGAHRLCACGESDNKPYCDGSHGRTGSDKTPVLFRVEAASKVAVCQCGKSNGFPLCDGTHSKGEA
jgi:CDGSH-type Zn-finger protein